MFYCSLQNRKEKTFIQYVCMQFHRQKIDTRLKYQLETFLKVDDSYYEIHMAFIKNSFGKTIFCVRNKIK